MAMDAAEFWRNFENETGEKVLARSIGQVYRSPDKASGVWGLLVLTDKSFRFKHMPNDNWLLSLFRRVDRSAEPEKLEDVVIPRAEILSVNAPKKGFLDKLFGSAFANFSVSSRGSGAELPVIHRFSVDPGSGLLKALEDAVAAGAQPI